MNVGLATGEQAQSDEVGIPGGHFGQGRVARAGKRVRGVASELAGRSRPRVVAPLRGQVGALLEAVALSE
ncbi:MAG: hypothetical protein ACYDH5_09650, partial [Acidimicrobiales bacterium]